MKNFGCGGRQTDSGKISKFSDGSKFKRLNINTPKALDCQDLRLRFECNYNCLGITCADKDYFVIT